MRNFKIPIELDINEIIDLGESPKFMIMELLNEFYEGNKNPKFLKDAKIIYSQLPLEARDDIDYEIYTFYGVPNIRYLS